VFLIAWITVVVVELFLFDIWFSFDYTSSSGSDYVLRWGVVSTALAVTIPIATLWWLISVGRQSLRLIRDSRSLSALAGFWVGLGILYIATDVFLAEGVRGIAIIGPETRWPVLLSAAFGIAAAVVAIGLVHAVTDAVARIERG
jgi:hypothetical protein